MYTPSLEDQQSYLANAKVLHRMSKTRSTIIIEYVEDPRDEWFIYVVRITKKNQEWKSCNMIVQKDLCNWLIHNKTEGWTEDITTT